VIVDLPCSISADELEIPSRSDLAFLDSIEGSQGGADVNSDIAVPSRPFDDEFHERGPIPATDALGPASVLLNHQVFQKDFVGGVAEINHCIHALGHGKGELSGRDGFRKFPGVLAELDEAPVAQAEMVDPCI